MDKNTNDNYVYDAFISYRHVMPDKILAERLHKLLETYRVPSYLVEKGVPGRLRRVFLDSSELPTDSNLSESIQKNLESSRFLIVVCSPRTLESRWVLKEVETFIALGRRERILTLLIEGEPEASFPPMLRYVPKTTSGENGGETEAVEEVEPLAADIRADSIRGSIKKLSVEKLRLLAPIIGCTFDELFQRHKRRQKQQRIAYTAGSLCILLLMSGFALWMQDKKALEKDRLNVAAEVMNDIISMDSRLTYVYDAIDLKKQNDEFSRQLGEIRNNVAPALNQTADIRYQQIVMNQQVASLRQAINTSPLRTDYGDVLGQAILHSGIDQQKIREFFDSLKIVEDTTNSLIEAMSAIATQNPDDQAYYDYNQEKLNLEVALLNNRSELAYINGLELFNELEKNLPGEYAKKINQLQNLEPKHLASEQQLILEEKKLIDEAASLLKERQQLVATANQLNQEKLKEYEELNKLLVINPTDSYQQVGGKAKSLRQLGRNEESMAAYQKYKEMFAYSDPTATLYADTACLFVAQAAKLGFDGGAYIFQVNSGSTAETTGLQAGDIIVSYGDTMVSDPDTLIQATKKAPAEQTVQLGYLRKNQANILQLYKVNVLSGTLGVGLINI